MISAWEIHVQTSKSISDIIAYLKTKGIASDFKMCKEGHGILKIKHPQANTLHSFMIKLYDEIGDTCEYELTAWSESEFNYLKDMAKDI